MNCIVVHKMILAIMVILSSDTKIQWGSHFEGVTTTQALDHQQHIQPIDAPLLMFPLSYSAYNHVELVSWLCWLLNFWLPTHSIFFFLDSFSFITLLCGTHRDSVSTTWQIVKGEITHKRSQYYHWNTEISYSIKWVISKLRHVSIWIPILQDKGNLSVQIHHELSVVGPSCLVISTPT